MHKYQGAQYRAQIVLVACALLFAASSGACGDDDSGSSGSGGSGGSSGSAGKASGGSGGSAGKATGGTGGASGSGGACSASSGGPVTASGADAHCKDSSGKAIVQETKQSSCTLPADAAIPDDDGGAPDFGATLKGSEGDDDDCKYHIKWTASCITPDANFTITFSLTTTSDGKPVTGLKDANFEHELFLSSDGTHIAPSPAAAKYAETSTKGTYTLGPLKVDQSGNWTVRFHIHPECPDILKDSPHGHAAFFINVP